ncbi:MAG: hypothetical protein CUN49_08880 [Candidatus Thermofonsia Clade 1 bacterium]|jgi:gas vesicle protein|uniref:YtxH domain-containing protein n=1 Tax=Candidatus Thermofonsia Clade 1 bacterium TaxID=2364210 RepID=A0A2M8PDZ8_9CHLR|nr:MAG: hypothetical protein CUN49_08880 [Candidatus Thermofonsia Clade 1 bacterium]RMF49480.1 MAG: hypothetical protein D6749_13055 [Chloroflexota bacterium]
MAGRGEGRSFWLGALIGGLIGALWALWHAPRSGAQTRRAMRQALEARLGAMRRHVAGLSLEEALAEGKETARQLNKQR